MFPTIDDLPNMYTTKEEMLTFIKKIKSMKRYKKWNFRLADGLKINREKLIMAHLFADVEYNEDLGIVPIYNENSCFNIEDRDEGIWSVEFEPNEGKIHNQTYDITMKVIFVKL